MDVLLILTAVGMSPYLSKHLGDAAGSFPHNSDRKLEWESHKNGVDNHHNNGKGAKARGRSWFWFSSYKTSKSTTAARKRPAPRPRGTPLAVTFSAGLCFLLLALSVLEAMPSQWMVLLESQWLPKAYWILFVFMVVVVFGIVPFVAGAQFVHLWIVQRQEKQRQRQLRKLQLALERAKRGTSWQSRCLYFFLVRIPLVLLKTGSWICCCLAVTPVRLLRKSSRSDSNLPVHEAHGHSDAKGQKNSASLNGKTTDGGGVASSASQRRRAAWWCCRLETLLGGLVAVALVFTILSWVGPWVVRNTTTTANGGSLTQTPWLTVAVSWLCAMGILLSACMNGFGSVSLPHAFLSGWYLGDPIKPEVIVQAERELEKAVQAIRERRQQIDHIVTVAKATPPSSSSITNGSSPSRSIASSLFGFSKRSSATSTTSSSHNSSSSSSAGFSELGEEVVMRRKVLTNEIDFLYTLVSELEEDIQEMKQSQQMAVQARTRMGRIQTWLGLVFSVVLLVRLLSAFHSVFTHHRHHHHHHHTASAESDPITMVLLWLVGHDYMSQQDFNTVSQFISLLLTALLSITQVRTFWRTVQAVRRRLAHWSRERRRKQAQQSSSTSRRATSTQNHHHPDSSSSAAAATSSNLDVSSYIVACLMGCYVLACVVLTKLMLPAAYRRAFSQALVHNLHHNHGHTSLEDSAPMVLHIRSYAVNLTFGVAALISAAVLGILLGIQRQNAVRNTSYGKVAPMLPTPELDP